MRPALPKAVGALGDPGQVVELAQVAAHHQDCMPSVLRARVISEELLKRRVVGLRSIPTARTGLLRRAGFGQPANIECSNRDSPKANHDRHRKPAGSAPEDAQTPYARPGIRHLHPGHLPLAPGRRNQDGAIVFDKHGRVCLCSPADRTTGFAWTFPLLPEAEGCSQVRADTNGDRIGGVGSACPPSGPPGRPLSSGALGHLPAAAGKDGHWPP